MGKVNQGDERPEIGADAWLVQAYSELSTCRSSGGGGLLPIPWTAIVAYADRHGLDDTFTEIILIADADFTASFNKKHQAELDGKRRHNKGSKPQA